MSKKQNPYQAVENASLAMIVVSVLGIISQIVLLVLAFVGSN